MFTTEQIRETVTTAVGRIPAGYQDRVEAVVTAVKTKVDEARSDAAESLRTAAQSLGAREADVERILTEAGLIDPPVLETVTPQDAGTDLSALQATVQSLQSQVERLTSFGRRHGFSG